MRVCAVDVTFRNVFFCYLKTALIQAHGQAI